MKFSVWPFPGRFPEEILDLARFADEADWFGFWFADHYMSDANSNLVGETGVQECWPILGAVAAVTSKVRLGPLVAPTTFHHPALLANRISTIDQLSNGRAVLGMGAGWQENEHRAYGVDLMKPKDRVDRFEEAITIVRSLLDEDSTTFEGAHFNVVDAPCEPKSVQSQLPIVVGTSGPRMQGIAIRHAQEWNTWGAPEHAQTSLDKFVSSCEREGADPATFHKSVQATVTFAPKPVGSSSDLSRSIIGSVEQVIDEVGQLSEMGFDEFIVPDFALGKGRSERFAAYGKFIDEVAPALH